MGRGLGVHVSREILSDRTARRPLFFDSPATLGWAHTASRPPLLLRPPHPQAAREMAVRHVVLLPLLVQQAAQSRAEEGPQRPPLPLLQVTVINCTRSGASFLQPLVARVGASGGTTDRVNLPSLIESIDSDFAGGELGTAFAEASITSPTRGMTSAIAPRISVMVLIGKASLNRNSMP